MNFFCSHSRGLALTLHIVELSFVIFIYLQSMFTQKPSPFLVFVHSCPRTVVRDLSAALSRNYCAADVYWPFVSP